jgi:hypothetical protein
MNLTGSGYVSKAGNNITFLRRTLHVRTWSGLNWFGVASDDGLLWEHARTLRSLICPKSLDQMNKSDRVPELGCCDVMWCDVWCGVVWCDVMCGVLCCEVMWCYVMCCVMWCIVACFNVICVVVWCDVLWRDVMCVVMCFNVMCVVWCDVMWCVVTLCGVMCCDVMCCVMGCVLWCHVMWYEVRWCDVWCVVWTSCPLSTWTEANPTCSCYGITFELHFIVTTGWLECNERYERQWV